MTDDDDLVVDACGCIRGRSYCDSHRPATVAAADLVAADPAGDDLAGVILCTRGGRQPTDADLAAVREFAAFLRTRKPRAPEPPPDTAWTKTAHARKSEGRP